MECCNVYFHCTVKMRCECALLLGGGASLSASLSRGVSRSSGAPVHHRASVLAPPNKSGCKIVAKTGTTITLKLL